MTDISRYQPPYGNGAASASTINNYPEHLNPFYEDENHKRLRFLEHNPAAHKSKRRGSLSSLRDGLRDLWQFSSIRFGKKRSSTLGINKTSESPPPLRRDVYVHDTNEDTFASTSAYRNTVSTPGYGTPRESQSYTTTPLFVRHTRYRSSLQDRQKENEEIGFMRNDRYRSTIQNGFATYSNGMVTSTPRKKQSAPMPYGTTPRGAQRQQENTNPFDVEMEPEVDTLSTVSVDSNYSGTLRSHTTGTRTRTKRRAPLPPPVFVLPANRVSPTMEEPAANDLQTENLRNLTAEIESFVRISSTEGDASNRGTSTMQTSANVEATVVTEQNYDVNNNSAQVEIPTTVSTIESEIVLDERTQESTKTETTHTVTNASRDPQSAREEQAIVQVEEPKIINTQSVDVITVDTAVAVGMQTNPTPSPRKKSEKVQPKDDDATKCAHPGDVDFANLALPTTPVPKRRSNRENREKYITQNVTPATSVVNKIEPIAVKPAASASAEADDEGPTTTIIVDNLEYRLKVAPIHTEITTKIENARMKISESTGNLPLSTIDNAPNERRRSVRDIIASINKSQSMLKVNQDQPTNGLHETQSTDSMTRNMRELNDREKEIQNLLQDISEHYGAGSFQQPGDVATSSVDAQKGRGSYYDNLPEDLDAKNNIYHNLDDKNNMYAGSGCRIKKSPTKTVIVSEGDDPQFQDCINWNPLPKPRRSYHQEEKAIVVAEQLPVVPNAP
ncbi:uncharacterized protein LOC128723146 [Anopheles nili]|uniref:uncharacterized protein LOC128723146 n=1 Tax=Anopheles nili TaxID=185578 RepID=UPI00237AE0AA|nr:uncharacterized protein LOC128723146 [Anopheles nili]